MEFLFRTIDAFENTVGKDITVFERRPRLDSGKPDLSGQPKYFARVNGTDNMVSIAAPALAGVMMATAT